MYGTYLRLDITVHDGWRIVVRAAAKKLTADLRAGTRRGGKHGIASIARCLRITKRRNASSEPGVSDAHHFPSSARARARRAFCIFGGYHHAPLHHRNDLSTIGVSAARL